MLRLVVSDVDVLQSVQLLLLFDPVKVGNNLVFLDTVYLFIVNAGGCNRMLLLDELQTDPPVGLQFHLLPLFEPVEERCGNFFRPEWQVLLESLLSGVGNPFVFDGYLVVVRELEGPDFVFFESMVDRRIVGVRRVGIE